MLQVVENTGEILWLGVRDAFRNWAFGVTEENWRDATARVPHFVISETPRFVGRAVVALAADADRARWNGQASPRTPPATADYFRSRR